MDLIAGDAREIMLAVGMEDWSGLRDPGRFPAYISLGGGMDPSWSGPLRQGGPRGNRGRQAGSVQ